jgi:hypothetical protein
MTVCAVILLLLKREVEEFNVVTSLCPGSQHHARGRALDGRHSRSTVLTSGQETRVYLHQAPCHPVFKMMHGLGSPLKIGQNCDFKLRLYPETLL